jgi:hypothetical protein
MLPSARAHDGATIAGAACARNFLAAALMLEDA